MEELQARVVKYLEDNFKDSPLVEDEFEGLDIEVFFIVVSKWLTKNYKIIISGIPSIDPKYNSRLWYRAGLFEWSRSHQFWMNKSEETRYYDDTVTALGHGLLQGLEIAKIKFIDEKDIQV